MSYYFVAKKMNSVFLSVLHAMARIT